MVMQTLDMYRELVERLQPADKIKRLETELNGDPATGALGLKGAFFATYRDCLSQERLVRMRSEMKLPPGIQQELADQDLEKAMYQLESQRLGLAFLAEQIERVEGELAAASKIGTGEIALAAEAEQKQEQSA